MNERSVFMKVFNNFPERDAFVSFLRANGITNHFTRVMSVGNYSYESTVDKQKFVVLYVSETELTYPNE